ncbi:MAG: GlsB/YeaQ/YmgE family stress response membrane protein [Bacteroidales bacterium]|nr:GlsB/YeaQ/YmgE family stress response membrane protein [Bacteroidales bacterium]MBD5246172.1 GlsB/YeaQ/YmgE family stress response membrane protein [Barnesiella sp.]
MEFVWFILIGICAGAIAGRLMQGSGYGCLVNMVVGIIGSVLGGWLLGMVGFDFTGIIGSLVTATIGAIVFLWILSLFNKRP